ncbi:hypothetical protein Scep_026821 [Stephania cephalantha]|uniref:HMA domain-containing protein n=1 Tax=Stephania cephalantha TaxID=152367 RepID=A0AAP0HSD4_9MAGN
MATAEKKEVKEGAGVITAVYKLNLHCPQCARQIHKALMRTEEVRNVEVNAEKNEIKVHGKIDIAKIHERIKKITKKKVDLICHIPKSTISKESSDEIKIVKEKKETKELVLSTTTVKVHMHCGKCEYDLKKKILKLKGVHSVKTDFKAQTLAAEGTIEPTKLVEYIQKRVHKYAEIVTQKKEQEKKEKVKEVETKKVTEEEKKVIEVKTAKAINNAPYIVHHVYAPQLFSDENPNACSIM